MNNSEQSKLSIALGNRTKEIELNPQNAELYYFRASTLYTAGRYDEALADCEKAIKLDTRNAEYYHAKGVTLHTLKRYEEALIELTIATNLEPEKAEYFYLKGLIAHDLRRYEDSLLSVCKAVELKPKEEKYLYSKGLALYNLNRYEEALTVLDKVVELDSLKAKYYNLRGLVLQGLNLFEEALSNHRKAIELNSANYKYYSNLVDGYIGKFSVELGNGYFINNKDSLEVELQLVKDSLDKAVELYSKNDYYYFQLSTLCLIQVLVKVKDKDISEEIINSVGEELQLALKSINKAIELDSTKDMYFVSRNAIVDLLNYKDSGYEN